jgi:hypothetical protein
MELRQSRPLLHTVPLTIIAACFCLLFLHVIRAAASPPNILLLSSYHHGDAWGDREVAGFLRAFPAGQAQVFVEYMDSRRSDFATRPDFEAYLKAKYRDISVSLLVAIDDEALDFWLANREQLFPGRPLVFCGVNDFTPDRTAGHGSVTGIGESPNILDTLELALNLLPASHTVVALGSNQGITFQANWMRFRRAVTALGRRVRAVELANIDFKGALAALSSMPKDTVVLHLSPLLDDADHTMLPGRDIAALGRGLPLPGVRPLGI